MSRIRRLPDCSTDRRLCSTQIDAGVQTDAATVKAAHESDADHLGDEPVLDDASSSVDLNQVETLEVEYSDPVATAG